MKGLYAACWTETIKAMRSKLFFATLIAFSFIAVIMGLLVFVAKHPEISGKSAVIATKASIIGRADWPSYFGLLIQSILSIGALGFGVVSSWVFGREYSDRTVKDLLALPVSRFTIVFSKLIITLVWSAALAAVFFIAALLTGLAVGISGWSNRIAVQASMTYAGSSFLTMLLCAPVAFIAGFGRGYLLPIGFVILTLILTQLAAIGAPGLTPYFPWAVPALYSGVAGAELPPAGAVSYLILALTFVLGTAASGAWWSFADQT